MECSGMVVLPLHTFKLKIIFNFHEFRVVSYSFLPQLNSNYIPIQPILHQFLLFFYYYLQFSLLF